MRYFSELKAELEKRERKYAFLLKQFAELMIRLKAITKINKSRTLLGVKKSRDDQRWLKSCYGCDGLGHFAGNKSKCFMERKRKSRRIKTNKKVDVLKRGTLEPVGDLPVDLNSIFG